jgi:hypothetical protein
LNGVEKTIASPTPVVNQDKKAPPIPILMKVFPKQTKILEDWHLRSSIIAQAPILYIFVLPKY